MGRIYSRPPRSTHTPRSAGMSKKAKILRPVPADRIVVRGTPPLAIRDAGIFCGRGTFPVDGRGQAGMIAGELGGGADGARVVVAWADPAVRALVGSGEGLVPDLVAVGSVDAAGVNAIGGAAAGGDPGPWTVAVMRRVPGQSVADVADALGSMGLTDWQRRRAFVWLAMAVTPFANACSKNGVYPFDCKTGNFVVRVAGEPGLAAGGIAAALVGEERPALRMKFVDMEFECGHILLGTDLRDTPGGGTGYPDIPCRRSVPRAPDGGYVRPDAFIYWRYFACLFHGTVLGDPLTRRAAARILLSPAFALDDPPLFYPYKKPPGNCMSPVGVQLVLDEFRLGVDHLQHGP